MIRRVLRRVADRILPPIPGPLTPTPPAPFQPADPSDIMSRALANAPELFAEARRQQTIMLEVERDRRKREGGGG